MPQEKGHIKTDIAKSRAVGMDPCLLRLCYLCYVKLCKIENKP